MGFGSYSWGPDEEITAAKLNYCHDSLQWLYSRFIPSLNMDCVADYNMGFYMLHAHIAPNQFGWAACYAPADGATYKVKEGTGVGSGYQQFNCGIEIKFPTDTFKAQADQHNSIVILGHSVGSGVYPWIFCGRHEAESNTGYTQWFGMTDYPATAFYEGGWFCYTALIFGERYESVT